MAQAATHCIVRAEGPADRRGFGPGESSWHRIDDQRSAIPERCRIAVIRSRPVMSNLG